MRSQLVILAGAKRRAGIAWALAPFATIALYPEFAPRATRDDGYGAGAARAHTVDLHRDSLGLSTSRRRSPTRLIATMAMTSATPGKVEIQYFPESR